MLALANIDLYCYEIHSLIKAFYPSKELKVIVKDSEKYEKALKDGEEFSVSVIYEEDRIRFLAGGSEFETGAPFGSCFNVKSKECKDALKTLIYDSMVKVTGNELPWGDLIGIRPTKIAMTRMENGDTKEEAAQFMIDEHRCSKEKADLAADIAVREAGILSSLHGNSGYSLYVGIPFCPTTCLYCSFPSNSLAAWKNRVDEYLDALIYEIKESAKLTEGKILDTVYIGGGTPTTLDPAQLDRLISAIKEYYPTKSIQEFTVEAGRPDSITKEKLEVLRKHGITRISVNPQTMNDRTLKIIGRHHSAKQVTDAFKMARECGFDNINMDIILGLPGEDADDVRVTIEEIEKLSPDSLTVHSLAIKRASRLARYIEEHGFPVLENTDETMKIASGGAEKMNMHPYYLYRQKQMSGNFENTGYAVDGKAGIYNILIMEEIQSIMALGAGSITKRVFDNGRIERCDNAKDIDTYITNIDEMIDRKKKLFAE